MTTGATQNDSEGDAVIQLLELKKDVRAAFLAIGDKYCHGGVSPLAVCFSVIGVACEFAAAYEFTSGLYPEGPRQTETPEPIPTE